MFSLTDILQIAVIIREVAFVLFLPIFSRARTIVLTKPRPQGFSVAVPLSGYHSRLPSLILKRFNLSIDFSIIYSPRVSHNQTKPKEKKDRMRKKEKINLGYLWCDSHEFIFVRVWTVLVIKT